MSRELLNHRAKELCLQISIEKNHDRMLALVAELDDLLQNQPEQKPRAETRSDEISVSRLPEAK